MRIYIFTAVTLLVFYGCSSNTDVLTSDLSTTASDNLRLVAGGYRLVSGDTEIFFEAAPSVSVKNNTSSGITRTVYFEYGVLNGDKWIRTLPQPYDSSVLEAKSFQPGRQVSVTGSNVVAISTTLRGASIGYRLRLIGSSSDTTTVLGHFKSPPFDQRFRGYSYTTETSPAPIGSYDPPDDGDWVMARSGSEFGFEPVYPNPFTGNTTATLRIPADSRVRLDLLATPSHVIRTIVDDQWAAGFHSIQLSDSLLSQGLYRLRFIGGAGTTVDSAHGDIVVGRP